MDLFDEALHFAIVRHSGQTRKMSSAPYILHPMEVASIVGTMTEDREILAAAALHDTLEDTSTDPEEIRSRFGERVFRLVIAETEPKLLAATTVETWELRKQTSLQVLSQADDPAVRMLWLGDKLSNMRSFAREYRKRGDGLWNSLHQHDPARQAWYYRTIASLLSPLQEFDAYQEYLTLVNHVFQTVPPFNNGTQQL